MSGSFRAEVQLYFHFYHVPMAWSLTKHTIIFQFMRKLPQDTDVGSASNWGSALSFSEIRHRPEIFVALNLLCHHLLNATLKATGKDDT